MGPSTPEVSAATSTLTFSVSSWTSVSPASTDSPSRLSQAPTVASTTDSPSVGTRTSTGMGWHFLEGLGDNAPLFGGVRLGPAFGWTGAFGSTDIAHVGALPDQLAQAIAHIRPGAHVARFLLQPDDLARIGVALEGFGQLVGWQGIQLFHAQDGQAFIAGAALVRFHLSPD